MQSTDTYDYAAIGHVTVDVLPDGSRRPGGSVVYAALQAARLGRRALILTRGVPSQIEALLAPYRDELELMIQPADATTTLQTEGIGAGRRQRLLAWAGPLEPQPLPASAVVHLAPVARELRWLPAEQAPFVGLTPQGLARRWSGLGGEVTSTPPWGPEAALALSCDAIVVSEQERKPCSELIERAREQGAIVAVTAGHAPNEILLPDGRRLEIAVDPIERPADDLGAGDVYASAFFVALAQERGAEAAAALANRAAALRMLGEGPGAVAYAEQIEPLGFGAS
jgi:sugar/nucleoside kinase (ribokinase family)